jgi:hypothetical protein
VKNNGGKKESPGKESEEDHEEEIRNPNGQNILDPV